MNFQFDESNSLYDGTFEYRFKYNAPLTIALNGPYISAAIGPKSLDDWKDLRGSAVRYPHNPKGCTLHDELHDTFMDSWRAMQKALIAMVAEQGMLPYMYMGHYEDTTFGWTNQGEYTLDDSGTVCIPSTDSKNLKTLDLYDNYGKPVRTVDISEVKRIKESR